MKYSADFDRENVWFYGFVVLSCALASLVMFVSVFAGKYEHGFVARGPALVVTLGSATTSAWCLLSMRKRGGAFRDVALSAVALSCSMYVVGMSLSLAYLVAAPSLLVLLFTMLISDSRTPGCRR